MEKAKKFKIDIESYWMGLATGAGVMVLVGYIILG